jgi:hypothetical protein
MLLAPRVLEVMFPGWTADELFGPCPAEIMAGSSSASSPAKDGPFADLVAVFPTRADFACAMPPHTLFDGAGDIRAAGLSLNLICQQYPDRHLQGLVESGASLRCLFLDPDGEAIRLREREEGYTDHQLVMLTKLNIEVLSRLRDRLPSGARDR